MIIKTILISLCLTANLVFAQEDSVRYKLIPKEVKEDVFDTQYLFHYEIDAEYFLIECEPDSFEKRINQKIESLINSNIDRYKQHFKQFTSQEPEPSNQVSVTNDQINFLKKYPSNLLINSEIYHNSPSFLSFYIEIYERLCQGTGFADKVKTFNFDFTSGEILYDEDIFNKQLDSLVMISNQKTGFSGPELKRFLKKEKLRTFVISKKGMEVFYPYTDGGSIPFVKVKLPFELIIPFLKPESLKLLEYDK